MSLYYFQTNIICLLVLFIIFLSIRNRKDAMPARRVAFSRLLLIIAIICVSDVVAWYFNGKPGKEVTTVLYISNIIYDAAITWAGYAWLNYVEIRIKSLDYNHRKRMYLSAIPFIIMLLLLVTNPWTKLLFSIDANNVYARSDGIFIHWIISWFYLVYATIEVMVGMKKAASKAEREQLIPMLWFIVPPAVAAVLQMFLYGLTSTQCGMTLAALIIAINFMADEVLKDTLTGLNNRRALESTMIERLQKSTSRITVMMCDIDKFKSINDTLGHAAGDLVLRRLAEILKTVCGEWDRHLFLCRFGGDEFIICGTDMGKEEISRLTAKIEESIESVNGEYSDSIRFGISVGDATGICTTYDDVAALISMADAIMYDKKQARKKLEEA